MKNHLHLIIVTPSNVLVDDRSVLAVRASDNSGSFGILPKHTSMVTALDDSVVRWHDDSGTTSYCAIRRGVLMVQNASTVRIACREGLRGNNLSQLKLRVRELRAQETDADRTETLQQMRMHTQAMRNIMGYLGNTPTTASGESISALVDSRREPLL